jgi:hypothetical protein
MVAMPQESCEHPQSAVQLADMAIADYFRSLPGQRAATPEQRAEYQRLLGEWSRAVEHEAARKLADVVLAA